MVTTIAKVFESRDLDAGIMYNIDAWIGYEEIFHISTIIKLTDDKYVINFSELFNQNCGNHVAEITKGNEIRIFEIKENKEIVFADSYDGAVEDYSILNGRIEESNKEIVAKASSCIEEFIGILKNVDFDQRKAIANEFEKEEYSMLHSFIQFYMDYTKDSVADYYDECIDCAVDIIKKRNITFEDIEHGRGHIELNMDNISTVDTCVLINEGSSVEVKMNNGDVFHVCEEGDAGVVKILRMLYI